MYEKQARGDFRGPVFLIADGAYWTKIAKQLEQIYLRLLSQKLIKRQSKNNQKWQREIVQEWQFQNVYSHACRAEFAKHWWTHCGVILGSETYSLRVHYRRTPRKLDPRQIPVTGGSMSIHGSIFLMLFKLQKTEKGDFFSCLKNLVIYRHRRILYRIYNL